MQQEDFQRRLAAALADLPVAGERRYALAFSGGLDSTVLLAALCRLDPAPAVRVLHIDHGLHANSAAWEEHCRAAAEALGLEYESERIEVRVGPGASFEGPAREARYRALAGMMRPGEILLTAHHADDQLETLLLRLVRGTGVRGLRGIAASTAFGPGLLARPLLGCSRAALRARAESWHLRWLEDPANVDPRYDRSYLRMHVLPRLLERWPSAPLLAARLAEHMSDAERVLSAMAQHDARAIGDPRRVPLETLLELPPERQRNLLRSLIERAGLSMPNARQLEELRGALRVERRDAKTRVSWPGGEARVYGARLYLLEPLPPGAGPGYRGAVGPAQPWVGPEGRIELEPAAGEGLPQSWLDAALQVRFRAGGERLPAAGAARGAALKRWLQDARIVPWMRDRIPLLYRGERLVAVGDLWICDEARAAPSEEPRLRVVWTGHPPLR